jgi:hypothetical protein
MTPFDIAERWLDTDTVPDPDDVAALAEGLATDPVLRDGLLAFGAGVGDALADLIEDPNLAGDVFSRVPDVQRLLRVVPMLTLLAEQDRRADPLAMLAVLAWTSGGENAQAFTDAALAADPDHGLAGLMAWALSSGLPFPVKP